MNTKKLILEVITSLLLILFLYTALSKFLDFDGFTYDMNNQPFPNELTPLLVWLVPGSEIAITATLIFKVSRMAGLIASAILMGMFTLYTALVLSNVFQYVPCSCGGVIKHLTWTQHLAFNIFFLTISVIGIYLEKENRSKAVAPATAYN